MLQFSTLAFFSVYPSGRTKVLRLSQLIPTFASASNSVILSLASHIIEKFPKMPHPSYLDLKMEELETTIDLTCDGNLDFHPLYEAWCDLLCQSVLLGHGYRHKNTLYIGIKVEENYIDQLQNFGLLEFWSQGINFFKIFNIQQTPEERYLKKRKVFLINFAKSQLQKNQLLPKIHVPGLMIGTLFNNQQWSAFCVLKGQFPSKAQLLQADSLILPGSSNSVLDKIESVDLFTEQLIKAINENCRLKILCICYGHQLISKLFSSKVVKKNRVQGHQRIVFSQQEIIKYKFLNHILQNNQQEWLLSEFHEDYVENVPQGFDIIANSNSCHVEAIVKQDGRILSLQFHPEYMSQYLDAYTNRAKIAGLPIESDLTFGFPTDKELQRHRESCKLMRLCVKEFFETELQLNL